MEWADGWKKVTNVDDRMNWEDCAVMRSRGYLWQEDWKSLYVMETDEFQAMSQPIKEKWTKKVKNENEKIAAAMANTTGRRDSWRHKF